MYRKAIKSKSNFSPVEQDKRDRIFKFELFSSVRLTVCLFLSLAAALKKLDPEHGEQILEYFQTHALLARDKACKSQLMNHESVPSQS